MSEEWSTAKQPDVKEKVSEFLSKKEKDDKEALFTDDDVKSWFDAGTKTASKICCMVYGDDGTGKTGVVFDYLTDKDVKEGYKLVSIDLDGGGMPLKTTYHTSKGKNLVVLDPLVTMETDEGTEIDYKSTFARVRAIVRYIRNNHTKEKIKAVVFDGLSTALSYAEQQMRLDKHIAVDGGVQTRYWLMRNKLFLETLEQIKSIPIAKFFIAHRNFILNQDSSSVISKTNAMMIQKIRCERKDTPTNVIFMATIDKSKYNVNDEGAKFTFCEVSKAERKHTWKTIEIFNALEGI